MCTLLAVPESPYKQSTHIMPKSPKGTHLTKEACAVKATAMWSIGCIFVVLLRLALCRSVSALSSGNNKIGKAIIKSLCICNNLIQC